MIIPKVPDRGGRTEGMAGPAKEMPAWASRKVSSQLKQHDKHWVLACARAFILGSANQQSPTPHQSRRRYCSTTHSTDTTCDLSRQQLLHTDNRRVAAEGGAAAGREAEVVDRGEASRQAEEEEEEGRSGRLRCTMGVAVAALVAAATSAAVVAGRGRGREVAAVGANGAAEAATPTSAQSSEGHGVS